MKSLFVIASLVISTLPGFAQTTIPSILWQHSLGGSLDDIILSSSQTRDGGYILAGYTNSNDGDITTGHHGGDTIPDVWIARLHPDGSLAWSKTFGGTLDDEAQSIVQTSDGGFVFAGYSGSSDGDLTTNAGYYDGWIVKLDSLGLIVWKQTFGGQGDDGLYSIKETSDQGFIVAGSSNSLGGDLAGLAHNGGYDGWVMKLSSTGTVQWKKTYGGNDDDEVFSIIQTSDGGYAFTGYTYSVSGSFSSNHGSEDLWVVKLNSLGVVQWQKLLGGTIDEEGNSIKQTSDGGYVIAGLSSSFDGDVTGQHSTIDTTTDFWAIKLDQSGSKVWALCYGGTDDDEATAVTENADHGFIISGSTSSIDGDVTNQFGPPDYWVVRTDRNGLMLWQLSLGGSDSDFATSLVQNNDGSFIVAGYSQSTSGEVTGNHGGYDGWVVKLGDSVKGSVRPYQSIANLQAVVYPNPIISRATFVLPNDILLPVSFSLYNMLGAEVQHSDEIISNSVVIDRGNLPAGIYQYQIIASNGVLRGQIVIQ